MRITKIKMKHVYQFIGVFTMLCIFSLNVNGVKASANSSEEWIISQDEEGENIILNQFTNEKIVQVIEYDLYGNDVEIDLNKYVNELNNAKYIKECEGTSINAGTGFSPVKLSSGFADGVYELHYK